MKSLTHSRHRKIWPLMCIFFKTSKLTSYNAAIRSSNNTTILCLDTIQCLNNSNYHDEITPLYRALRNLKPYHSVPSQRATITPITPIMLCTAQLIPPFSYNNTVLHNPNNIAKQYSNITATQCLNYTIIQSPNNTTVQHMYTAVQCSYIHTSSYTPNNTYGVFK